MVTWAHMAIQPPILPRWTPWPLWTRAYASSSSVYGGNKRLPFAESQSVDHPVSLYAATKKSNELMAPVQNGNPGEALTDAEADAYEAPFPDESYKAGSREFPGCVPIHEGMPSTQENAAAWEVLRRWEKPFLTAWGDLDNVSA